MFKTSPQLTLCSYEKVRAGVGMGRAGGGWSRCGHSPAVGLPPPRPPHSGVGGVPICSKQEPVPSFPTVLSAHRGTCSPPPTLPCPHSDDSFPEGSSASWGWGTGRAQVPVCTCLPSARYLDLSIASLREAHINQAITGHRGAN